MNSLELVKELYASGTLSKEASIRVLRHRDSMIKTAMIDMTEQYFGFGKYASIWNTIEKATKATSKAATETAKVTRVGPMFSGSEALRNIAPLLGIAGLVTLGTTLAKTGINAIGNLHTKGRLSKSYNGMFKEFPDLKEDKGQATKFFSMMSQYAPALAVNPVVAGTWVKQMMNSNVVDPKNIHSLIQAQKDWENVQEMKNPIIGFSRDIPQSGELFSKTVSLHNAFGASS